MSLDKFKADSLKAKLAETPVVVPKEEKKEKKEVINKKSKK
jgi:hypothetical protein